MASVNSVAEPVSGDLIAIPFPKSCICVIPRKAILKHLPQDLLIEGFRKGKRIRRARAFKRRIHQ